MSSRSLRVVSLAAAAASATVWLAACGSAGTTPAATTTPTTPTTSTSSPATAPTQTQSPQTQPPATSTPAVTTTPGLAACSGSSLRITVDASLANGAAGSVYYPLNFVNTSAATCQMYGFPGVSFVTSGDATGQQIGAAALRAGAFTKVSVRLAPGGTAHAWLKVAVAQNYPSGSAREPRTSLPEKLRLRRSHNAAAGSGESWKPRQGRGFHVCFVPSRCS